ncbi:MAG: HDOD domain-containing protein [Burkholderiales bacterium]|nr:HDOD domain-containing protein [Burkholderiales bacterium]MDR4517998.1 HDOD domain-containing protein [Nitrosomonas sp.]
MKVLEAHDRQEINTNLRKTLQQTELIPPLPETAQKILVLRNKPDANLEELVQLIEEDPSLAAFVMKYARMAIFGYGERITSVTHAVSLVLGYATALNVALGVASSGSLKIPNYGPLGRVRLWSEALQCAQLCRELSRCMAKTHGVNSGLAYLGGLLHNFGYLLFAHFCPKEFSSLNAMITHESKQDIRALEIQNFGITHDLIGLYLLKAWDLPEEVVMMAAKHHFPDCAGKHAIYVKLVATANRLLQKYGVSDSCPHIETSVLLTDLGVSESDAESELQNVLECQGELNELARGLMA